VRIYNVALGFEDEKGRGRDRGRRGKRKEMVEGDCSIPYKIALIL
jgi:hypothetical protein